VSGFWVGAIVGLVVGLWLSFSVARADARQRASGARVGMEYKSSLVIVPVLLALLGGLAGSLIAH
jgi:ABC-type antimicrobial peptide transport system permease subunit